MAYRIRGKDKTVGNALRRIADEQVGKAIASIDRAPPAEAVHDVRKRCKKLRALIRMVRPAFPPYTAENTAFRDMARQVSSARDAKVMQDTYDLLTRHYAAQIDRRALSSIRRRFTLQRKSQESGAGSETGLGGVRQGLLEARTRIGQWSLEAEGWEAIGPGLARTVGRARDAADLAYAEPSPAAFHELRKLLKYHWHHTRLLENIWPEMMQPRSQQLGKLTEMLGIHHDLGVFEERLSGDPMLYGRPDDVRLAIALSSDLRSTIEEDSRLLTFRLLAQPPRRLAAHWQALWQAWRDSVSTAPSRD